MITFGDPGMLDPGHSHSKTSSGQALPSESVLTSGSANSGEAASSEQDLHFPDTGLNIVKMSEAEYSHVQQILYSQIDPQSSEGNMENRVGSAFHSISSSSGVPQYPPTNQSSFSSSIPGCPALCPSFCPLASEYNLMDVNQSLGHLDFQEMMLMMLNNSNISCCSDLADQTPSETGGESSGAGTARSIQISSAAGINKKNENSGKVSESRSNKPAVRVRLEDRFKMIQSDGPRRQEAQDSMSSLGTVLHRPSHHQYSSAKSKVSADTGARQCPYPHIRPSENTGSCHTQTKDSVSCGSFCPLLEAAKHQQMSISRSYSCCYEQKLEAAKQSLGSQSKMVPEQVWMKIDDTLNKPAIKTSQVPTQPNFEPRSLSEIENFGNKPSSEASLGVSRSSTLCKAGEKSGNKKHSMASLRREKYNLMERDRRRRIRAYCDELNLLVPFCNMETDKATTLQWTTSFLRYIQEQHGEALKKDFESSFSKKRGSLKVSRLESLGVTQKNRQSDALEDAQRL